MTTISRHAVSESTTKPTSTTNSPAGIQVNQWRAYPCASSDPSSSGAAPVSTWKARAIAMAHAPRMTSTGIQCACLPSRRPMSAVTAKPAMGRMTRSGISDVKTHRDICVVFINKGVFLFR